jgi:phosphomannomutase
MVLTFRKPGPGPVKSPNFAPTMQTPIRFGTDGWRAIIAKDYTLANLQRVAMGTALWMKQRGLTSVVIGHDCRFGGPLFSETTARIMAGQGIRVFLARDFVSTPMVSLGVVKLQADMGVVITASHNPPDYNGFKLKSAFGGPTLPADISAVEKLVPEGAPDTWPELSALVEQGLIEYTDLEDLYYRHVASHFDLTALRANAGKLAYDAMYGAGQRIMRRLLPDLHILHGEYNPGFHGQAPEPIHRNLGELSELLASSGRFMAGLAHDGDADRIGMYDSRGRFVDSHHLLLLLLIYLYEYKGLRGKVIITFSVTDKMAELARQYGLEVEVTAIGFKYIAEIMTREDVLIGGEESGGLAVKGHIPERDGVWMGLLMLEFMARTGKSLDQLVEMAYQKVGPFHFDRLDLHIHESHKQAVIRACKEDRLDPGNLLGTIRKEDLDGFKYILPQGWLMFRPSGTEPVLRIYAQGPDQAAVEELLARATTLIHALA